jgi:hypothetical protein
VVIDTQKPNSRGGRAVPLSRRIPDRPHADWLGHAFTIRRRRAASDLLGAVTPLGRDPTAAFSAAAVADMRASQIHRDRHVKLVARWKELRQAETQLLMPLPA